MKKIFFLLILPFLLFSASSPYCTSYYDGTSVIPAGIICNDNMFVPSEVVLDTILTDYSCRSDYINFDEDPLTDGSETRYDSYHYLEEKDNGKCDVHQINTEYVISSSNSCPDNSTLDENLLICVPNPTCQDNATYVNSDVGCVCNPGFVLLDGQCVPPCEETNPPLVNENNLPLQRVFANSNDCIDYIKNVAVNQNGQCVTFDGCGYVYGYFEIKDDVNTTDFNVTYIDDNGTLVLPPIVVSDDPLLDDTSDNDNNYTTLSTIDTNNSDNVDMTPVLKSLSDMSLANHNDFKNVADKIDTSNTQLVNMNSKLSDVNTKLDTVNKNISDTNNKLDSLISGDFFTDSLSLDNFSDFFNNVSTDLDTITTSFDDTMNIIQNGFDTPSISEGQDPIFSAEVFGQTIDLDLCPSFSVFRPFLYFIFTLVFLLLAIKIFWAGMKIGNRE